MKLTKIIIFITIYQYAMATVTEGVYAGINGGVTNNIITYNQTNSIGLNTSGSQLYNSRVGSNLGIDFGYNGDAYNGFEIGYTNYFPVSTNIPNSNITTTTTANAVSLSYLPMLPTRIRSITVYGRLGLAYTTINEGLFTGCNCSSDNKVTLKGTAFSDYMGAGIRYKQSRSLSFKIEWVENGLLFPIGIGNNNSSVANWYSQNFNIGFNYHF